MHRGDTPSAVLIVLGSLFVAAAVAFAAFLWWQGETAYENAVELLESMPELPDDGDGDDSVEAERLHVVTIDAIELELPVIWEYEADSDALDITVCRYSGPDPGGNGNLVILGHDYLNGAHFGRLSELEEGAAVTLTTPGGDEHSYTVYEKILITPDNPAALDEYDEPHILTLMTCAENGNFRLLVRCRPEP